MDARVGAESLDAAEHGRARESFLAHTLDDSLVERLAVPPVRLTDEELQELSFAFEPHSALRDDAEVDREETGRPLPRRFAAASPSAPSSSSRYVSYVSVEKVVYAPRKPIASAERSQGAVVSCSVMSVRMNPSTSAPLTLTTNVPHGHEVGSRRDTAPSSP